MRWTDVSAAQIRTLRDGVVTLGVAAAVFSLSYADGGFSATTRAYAGIAAWWLLGAGAAIGVASARARVSRLGLAAVGLLAAFALWVLISSAWATDAERAFAQFNQVSLYVAVFAIAIVLARLVSASALVRGVALALVAVSAVALISRCFPSSFGLQTGTQTLSALKSRLSFPLGYWNGLGIEVALAYPLLLSIMASRRSRVVSILAALPLPILAADMYLTSSRGAFVAAGVAIVAFALLTPRRWTALAAVVLAGGSGAVAVAVLTPKNALVDGEVETAAGVHQGHHAALWIGVACVVTALVWLGCTELGKRLPSPPRVVGQATAGVIVLLAIVAIVLAHPVAKFDAFKSNSSSGGSGATQTQTHLLSSSGSGRWQFWGAAISEFRDHPVNGGGAGSWEAWWLQHRSLHAFTQYAHSLYLEALAELGIVGFLLLFGAVLAGIAGAVRSALALASAEVAGAAACGIAFFLAAAYDWIWQLSGIAIVGVGTLGFAIAALPSARTAARDRLGLLRPALALVAVAAILPQVVVLAAGIHIRNSQDAVAAGNATRAHSEALAAKAVESWASTPYLQLGLVSEDEADYGTAARLLDRAIDRSRNDWSLWYVAARIEARRGAIAVAKRDLDEARHLNPLSSCFRAAGC